jgi:hypothetical protein
MNQAIGDRAAIAFAIGFYQALGAGRTVEESYKLGCVQIRLQSIPEHLTPVLIKKGQEIRKFLREFKEPPEIEELAKLRTEGVALRNSGERIMDLGDLPAWIDSYRDWDERVLDVLGRLSKGKSEWLRTLNRMPIHKFQNILNAEHELYLNVFEEKLRRLDTILRQYLELPEP